MNKSNLKSIVAPLLDKIEPGKPNPLLPPELQQKEAEYKILSEFEAFVNRLTSGFHILKKLTHDKKLSEKLKNFSVPENLSYEDLKELKIREVLNIEEIDIEHLYEIARDLYKNKKFAESSDALFFLANLTQEHSLMWLTLGFAEFQQNKWDEAIKAFTLANLCDPTDLSSAVYSAECYRKLGNQARADLIIDTLLKNFSKEELKPFGDLKRLRS